MGSKQENKSGRPLTSLTGYIKRISSFASSGYEHIFYRGHSNKEYEMTPSVFRGDRLQHESHLYNDMLLMNPAEFRDDTSTIEKLARMQHHGCPTRLLDITSNPLVALYYAVSEYSGDGGKTGEVVAVISKNDSIKYYDDEQVIFLSNLSKLTYAEKKSINRIYEILVSEQTKGIFIDTIGDVLSLIMRGGNDSKYSIRDFYAFKKLYRYIKAEKILYEEHEYIYQVANYYRKIIVVRPKINNKRILAQSGAFLLYGHNATLNDSSDIRIEHIYIDKNSKHSIMEVLDSLNINNGSLYLDIDNYSKYLLEKYTKNINMQ